MRTAAVLLILLGPGSAALQAQQPSDASVAAADTADADPNLTRLFFGPTGRTLAAGDGYAGLFELFFPFVSYGVTDWLTISGGTPILPGATGEMFYLAPKVRVIHAPGLDVSAGVLAFFATRDLWDGGSVGILYGVGTAGDPDRSVTLGAGWGFAGEDFADRPVLMLGGESRLGPRSKLITENYFVPGLDGALVSGGLRLFRERLSGDVGIGALLGEEGTCCLPLLNFVYHFGGGR